MSTNTTSEYLDRFSLVSSFYGPGNITAWLCALASLFVTWCLNVEHRDKDTISVDLIFALAIPAVAAGHGIYLMFFLKEPDLEEHAGLSRLFTSPEPAIIQNAAAAEAALNVCETFAVAAVVLVFVAMLRGHLKRALSVVVVGLLAFSTEAIIFIKTRGVDVTSSNLTRPFLFNFFEVMVSIMTFLVVWMLVFVTVLFWPRVRRSDRKQQESQPSLSDPELQASFRAAINSDGLNGVAETVQDIQAVQGIQAVAKQLRGSTTVAEAEGQAIQALSILSVFFLQLYFAISAFGATGVFGSTDFMSSVDWTLRLPFFIPRSSNRMVELDQAVSAAIGIIALVSSLWYAFKSRKREVERAREKKQELDDTIERLRREWALTCRLHRLRQLYDKFDQTRDEGQRQLIIEARDSIVEGFLQWGVTVRVRF